jgi:hypothetical protein
MDFMAQGNGSRRRMPPGMIVIARLRKRKPKNPNSNTGGLFETFLSGKARG